LFPHGSRFWPQALGVGTMSFMGGYCLYKFKFRRLFKPGYRIDQIYFLGGALVAFTIAYGRYLRLKKFPNRKGEEQE